MTDLVRIVITEEHLNIFRDEVTNEITATLRNISKSDKIENELIINNLFGVQKLIINSFSNITYIFISGIINKPTIVLNHLSKVRHIELRSSDINFILGSELSKFTNIGIYNSQSSEIIDENNSIKNVLYFSLFLDNEENLILDEKYLFLNDIRISNCKLEIPYKIYPKLENLELNNVKGNFNNVNFPKMKYLYLIITDKFECEFNNCNFDSVEYLYIYLTKNSKVEEIYINSTFKNLNKLIVFSFSNSLKRLNLNISSENPIIKKVELPKSIELSGSLVQHLHEDIKNGYNIILPKGKNPYKIY